MSSLRRELPSPTALVAFEAVARHLNFTAAARELGVSQAAASRQVRILEDHLGLRLFDRTKRRVRLTPAGEALQAAVVMGLGHIVAAVRRLREDSRPAALTVATSIAFSTFWLIPRVGRFHAAHPEIELRLVTSDAEADWLADDVAAAVIFGDGAHPGFRARRLFGDEIVALASPDFFAPAARPATAAQLLGATLLHMDESHPTWIGWRRWFAACGIERTGQLAGRHFNNYAVAIQAARDGLGVVLGWRRLVEAELAGGTLVRAAPEAVVPAAAYHLVMPAGDADSPGARAFRNWIMEEAARDWA